ncbi:MULTISPECIES: NRDE family protein [unclassified Vibrio]|uniref:NRDE family protein n=1 Tax=Vibrio sp. HB236076 TaxID=3232307 RepID=A0AB39HJ81_9VIBR|nr:NRDE family protein [Vibrio sp. HB161653]MDP5253073.1 NRDE family protein [Vibrio sp. HB161653]
MCTASWLVDNGAFHLFFNRDEQIDRVIATPPNYHQSPDGTQWVMPIDPQGGGSWIGVNEYGIALCLLNFYQGQTPQGPLVSRGQLVKTFIQHQSVDGLIKAFKQLDLSHYAPFTFVLFAPTQSPLAHNVRAMQWDGHSLCDSVAASPVSSSGYRYEEVIQFRRQHYTQHVLPNPTVAAHIDFHRHRSELSYLGPNLQRNDAKTVSFTHICIDQSHITMDYQDADSEAITRCSMRLKKHKDTEKRHVVG